MGDPSLRAFGAQVRSQFYLEWRLDPLKQLDYCFPLNL